MDAPGYMAMGIGVSMRKWSQGGVIRSRLPASAKKAKTRSIGRGRKVRVVRRYGMQSSGLALAVRGGTSAWHPVQPGVQHGLLW